jgi:hypothetical protein
MVAEISQEISGLRFVVRKVPVVIDTLRADSPLVALFSKGNHRLTMIVHPTVNAAYREHSLRSPNRQETDEQQNDAREENSGDSVAERDRHPSPPDEPVSEPSPPEILAGRGLTQKRFFGSVQLYHRKETTTVMQFTFAVSSYCGGGASG